MAGVRDSKRRSALAKEMEMIVLVWTAEIGSSKGWELFRDIELQLALIKAEQLSKTCREVAVYSDAKCKVRWGPQDPGGLFNSNGVPTYDKGERETHELEKRSTEVYGEAGRAGQVQTYYPAPGATG